MVYKIIKRDKYNENNKSFLPETVSLPANRLESWKRNPQSDRRVQKSKSASPSATPERRP